MKIPARIARSFIEQHSPGAAGLPSSAGRGETHAAVHQARLLLATELAHHGKYGQAERLLEQIVEQSQPLRPAALHVLGQMYAQQSMFFEAEQCWQKALALEPGNPEYRAALDALVDERTRAPAFQGIMWLLPVVLAVLAVFALVRLESAGTQRDLQLLNTRLDGLNRRLDGATLRSSLPSSEKPNPAAGDKSSR